jgi:hypothetical protein
VQWRADDKVSDSTVSQVLLWDGDSSGDQRGTSAIESRYPRTSEGQQEDSVHVVVVIVIASIRKSIIE